MTVLSRRGKVLFSGEEHSHIATLQLTFRWQNWDAGAPLDWVTQHPSQRREGKSALLLPVKSWSDVRVQPLASGVRLNLRARSKRQSLPSKPTATKARRAVRSALADGAA
jgi:hypothetical protein